MQLNIGPTQQSNEANSVYQRNAIDRANKSNSDDASTIISLVLFSVIPILYYHFTHDFVIPGVEWHQTVYAIGMIISLIVSYFALPLLRALLGLVLIFCLGTALLAFGYELIKYIF